jgi:hypothetical protein
MSDKVLLQEEVNPLINAAQRSGPEVSAIHNHFFYEEPRLFYMHRQGMSQPAELIGKYTQAIKETKLFPTNRPQARRLRKRQRGYSTYPPWTGL